MNVLTIAGIVGGDARLNSINGQNGPVSVMNFTVAVKKRTKDQAGNNETLWVDCALLGVRADSLAQYVTKGSKISVSGEADIDSYQGQNGMVPKLTLRVNDLTLQGKPADQQHQQQGYQQQAPQQQQQQQRAAPPNGAPANYVPPHQQNGAPF